jgi:hypothetical protein
MIAMPAVPARSPPYPKERLVEHSALGATVGAKRSAGRTQPGLAACAP